MSRIPLVMGIDPAPSYDWFKGFDYSWFDAGNLGGLSSIPFFETVPERLDGLLKTSSARQQLRLGFGPGDCKTLSSSPNCTEACSDPSFLFTPTNLRACAALAGAALLVQNGTYSVDWSDAQTAEAIGFWHVPDLSTFDATDVFTRVAQCIPQSCTVARLGECAENVQDLGSVEIKADNLALISSRLGHYCDGVDLEINTDIAGPGVLLSYFLQTSLVVLFWLILKISRSWVRHVGVPFRCLTRQGKDEFQDRLAAVQSRLERSRLGTAVTASLMEFQEVQIYFIISAQIATIIAYNPQLRNTLGDNNSSYAAVILNSGLAAFLNISSMGCIFLAQCVLHKAGMRWWYIFSIMTISFILALNMFAIRDQLMPPVELLWQQFRDDAPLPLCGNNPSPMTYCGQSVDTSYLDNDIVGFVISGLGSLTWLGLFIDQLNFSLRTQHPTLRQRLSTKLNRYEGIVRRKSKVWRVLGYAYWLVIEFALICLVGYHLSQLILILENVSIGDIGKWGFGQLIAVMVWAPTIIKCIYFNTFGVKGGFEERIPKDYKIIRESGPEDSSPQELHKGLEQRLTSGI
ncbi:hypothetical protein B0T24DRAFT_609339 [Lasiosphaeria ovina]|uniref:Uncharacterized protein n=1 Tax=Lasiosphaeria ovina TaxID=92902 RepID=A0AAE0NNQ4_9PEZI|nr:hypothetical protein B0T24DRAFT_609339 [Lasiosphaeria ovina]